MKYNGKFRARRRKFVPIIILIVLLGACGCSIAMPMQTGYYKSLPLGVEATIPIKIRSVSLLASRVFGTYKRGADPSNIYLNDQRLDSLEEDLKEAFKIDLEKGGPFRKPSDDEAAYPLDVELSKIDITQNSISGFIGVMNFLLGLGIPVFFGSPVSVMDVRAKATFHLYAPDGNTLVQETVTEIRDKYAVSIYDNNRRRSIGSFAGLMLNAFKVEANKTRGDIITKRAVPMYAAFVGRAHAPVEGDASQPDGISPEIQPRAGMVSGRGSIALVIGIEKYRRDLPNATGAAADARMFAQFAQETFGLSPDGIHVLVDSDATKSSIEAELEEWIPRNASAKDTVYFFFAGHGASDPQSGARYLVPWDADPKFISTQGLSIDKLTSRLARLGSTRTFAFVDACFSGAGGRSVLAAGTRPLVISQAVPKVDGNRLIYLSASGPNETTGIGPANHGLFSYHLFRGLAGEADRDLDGSISLGELVEYTGKHVADDARRSNRDQHPVALGASGSASNIVVAKLRRR